MKLRLQSNSIRLRLKRGEMDSLMKNGRVEETITMGSGPEGILTYVLESSRALSNLQVIWKGQKILIQVPTETLSRWAVGDEVGLETILPVGKAQLQVLIEKDFACLNGTDEQNADTFPHPLAGTKC